MTKKTKRLKYKVFGLARSGATKLKLREFRTLKKKYSRELGHIKTAGKGRTKAAIIKELWRWWDDRLESEADNNESDHETGVTYEFNSSVSIRSPKGFMAKKHHSFAQRIVCEYRENGYFKSWSDVEQRLKGFKRIMITDHSDCSFVFDGPLDDTLCTTNTNH